MLKFDREFYRSDKWRELSKACKQRANWTCERCGWRPEKFERNKLEAHHVIPRPYGPDTLENLKALCGPCHQRNHRHNIHAHKTKSTVPKLFRAKSFRPRLR